MDEKNKEIALYTALIACYRMSMSRENALEFKQYIEEALNEACLSDNKKQWEALVNDEGAWF